MSIVFGPSTIILRKMICEYNGSFSGAAYGNGDPPFYVVWRHNHKRIVIPFNWRNRSVSIEPYQTDIKVYFN